MNKARLTKDFLFKIYKETLKTDLFVRRMVVYQDCIITRIRSVELERTYECYHVVGEDVDFIFKRADQYEYQIYENLMKMKKEYQLLVPKLYQTIAINSGGTIQIWLAIEFIGTKPEMKDNKYLYCAEQVDGLLMYKDGVCAEAWKEAAYSIARVHNCFWEVDALTEQPLVNSYERVLETIKESPRIYENSLLWDTFCNMLERFEQMSTCLVHFDLMPYNVLIKEKNVTV